MLGAVLLLRGDTTADRRNDVRDASEKFAVALSSYDYRHLDADFAKVRSMSTGGFRKEYNDLLGGRQFTDALTQSKARSVASVTRGPYITSLTGNEARTLTVVEQRISNADAKQARTVRTRVQLYLLHLASGGWKIDRVEIS